MVFCQFADFMSLQDISNGLKSATGDPNNMGIKEAPSKSAIDFQNELRDTSV